MLDTWIGSRSRSAHKSILTPWMLHRFVVNRETVQNVAFIGARQWRCSGLGLVRFSLFLLWTRARAAWTINDRLSKVARCTLLTATFLSAPRICIKHNRGVTLAVRSSYYWNISCRAFHRQIVSTREWRLKAHLCRLLGGWPLVTVATYRPVLLSLDFSFSLFFFSFSPPSRNTRLCTLFIAALTDRFIKPISSRPIGTRGQQSGESVEFTRRKCLVIKRDVTWHDVCKYCLGECSRKFARRVEKRIERATDEANGTVSNAR